MNHPDRIDAFYHDQAKLRIDRREADHRFQAFQPEKPETFSEFAKAMAVAVLLVAACYSVVLVLAASQVTP